MPAATWSAARARVVSSGRAAHHAGFLSSLGAAAAASGRRRLLDGASPIAADSLNSGWEGVSAGVSAASAGAGAGAAPRDALGVAFAVGGPGRRAGYSLHAANGLVVISALSYSGVPATTHAPRWVHLSGHSNPEPCGPERAALSLLFYDPPRLPPSSCACAAVPANAMQAASQGSELAGPLASAVPLPVVARDPRPRRTLSAFFDASFLGFAGQSHFLSPDAIFDKASKRFVLAAVSHDDALNGSAPSVLWLAASARADPRQGWRVLGLAAPPRGDASNPCGAGTQAV
jgi:hypothetical protein